MKDVTGIRKDRESIIKPNMFPEKQRRTTNQYRIDSWDAFFTDKHSWISGGLKISVHDWMRLRPRTIPTLIRRPSEHDAKTHEFFYLTVQDQTDPWIEEKIIRRPRKVVNVYVKNLAKLTTDFILESKFVCDQTNQLLVTTKVRSASTQRQAGSDMTLSLQQALLPQGGNRLHGASLLHGHRHQTCVSDKCFLQIKVFRFQAMAIFL